MSTRGTTNADTTANVNAHTNTSISNIKYANASELLEKAKSKIGYQSTVLKELCKLPPKRRVEYRPSTKPQGLSDRYASRAEGVVAQSIGALAKEACSRCNNKRKKACFTQCVVMAGYFSGACANCHFALRDYGCSLSGGYGRIKKDPERLRDYFTESEDDIESEDDAEPENEAEPENDTGEDASGKDNVEHTGLPTQSRRRRLNLQENNASDKDDDSPSSEPALSEGSDELDEALKKSLSLDSTVDETARSSTNIENEVERVRSLPPADSTIRQGPRQHETRNVRLSPPLRLWKRWPRADFSWVNAHTRARDALQRNPFEFVKFPKKDQDKPDDAK